MFLNSDARYSMMSHNDFKGNRNGDKTLHYVMLAVVFIISRRSMTSQNEEATCQQRFLVLEGSKEWR